MMAVAALAVSALSFYRSYLYTKHQLDVTVTEVSYVTNEGNLYMTVAFSNGGNRDAAVLRVEPALWGRQGQGHGRMDSAVESRSPRHPGDLSEDAGDRQGGWR